MAAAPAESQPASQLREDDIGQTSDTMLEEGALEDRLQDTDETMRTPMVPGEWLDRILELEQQGDREAALVELEAFRASFPDHPLPDEFRPLLDVLTGES